MAKEKKTESKKSEKSAPKASAKKAAAKKSPASSEGAPMIDTSLAASAAARMLAAGVNKNSTASSNAPRQESAMFKNLKAGINKPSGTTMSNLLEKSHGPEPVKSHQAFNKQVGHNQTFGADVTRSGVPRRTPG
jgi:hypothetical protein